MFTESNISKAQLKTGTYSIKVQGKNKFTFSRKISKTTKEQFIDIANQEFFKIYGKYWEGSCNGTSKYTTYDRLIKRRWSSIQQRTINGKYSTSLTAQTNPQFKSYHKRGITVNMSFEEFRAWMLSVEEIHNNIIKTGDNSSVDRINEDKGYEIGNIQLIPLHSNIEKRYNKKCKTNQNKEQTREYNRSQYLKNIRRLTEE